MQLHQHKVARRESPLTAIGQETLAYDLEKKDYGSVLLSYLLILPQEG